MGETIDELSRRLMRVEAALVTAERALTDGCEHYAARAFGGSMVARDEQYPWVAAMMHARDKCRQVLEASHG
jgi:hypothetical protein